MKNHLIIFVLGVLAVLSFLLMRSLEKSLQPKEQQQPTREIATAYNASAHYYNADHQLTYRIQGSTVRQYSNHYGTKFATPKIQGFENSELVWEGDALQGFLSGDNKYVKLSQDVYFTHAPHSMKPFYLDATVVYYDKTTNIVSSDQPSIIYDGTINQRSEQFSLNTQTDIVHFHETIQATYQRATGEGK